MRSTSPDTFEWLHGGFFLVHRWDAMFGDQGEDAGRELPSGAIQKGIMRAEAAPGSPERA